MNARALVQFGRNAGLLAFKSLYSDFHMNLYCSLFLAASQQYLEAKISIYSFRFGLYTNIHKEQEEEVGGEGKEFFFKIIISKT